MVRQWNSLSELWATCRSTTSRPGCSASHRVTCSPITSRSLASVVEKTFTPVNPAIVALPAPPPWRQPTVATRGRQEGGRGSGPRQDHRHALPAADAGGADRRLPAAPLQLVAEVGGDPGAAGRQRVAEGDGPPVHVGEVAGEPERPLHRQVLRGEGL